MSIHKEGEHRRDGSLRELLKFNELATEATDCLKWSITWVMGFILIQLNVY